MLHFFAIVATYFISFNLMFMKSMRCSGYQRLLKTKLWGTSKYDISHEDFVFVDGRKVQLNNGLQGKITGGSKGGWWSVLVNEGSEQEKVLNSATVFFKY